MAESSSSTNYTPYLTPESETPEIEVMQTRAANTSAAALLEACPLAADAIAGALGLSPNGWELEAANLTRSEVARRLRASDLGGLTDAVWAGLLQARERARPITPVLGEEGSAARHSGFSPNPSSMRPRVASDSEPSAGLHIPRVPLMHGRVPRSMESWQWQEGEWGPLGCMRGFGLVMYNIFSICSLDMQQKA